MSLENEGLLFRIIVYYYGDFKCFGVTCRHLIMAVFEAAFNIFGDAPFHLFRPTRVDAHRCIDGKRRENSEPPCIDGFRRGFKQDTLPRSASLPSPGRHVDRRADADIGILSIFCDGIESDGER